MWVHTDNGSKYPLSSLSQLGAAGKNYYLPIEDDNGTTYSVHVLELFGTVAIPDEDPYTVGDSDGTIIIGGGGTVILPDASLNAGRILYIKKKSRSGVIVIESADGIDDCGTSYSFGTGKLDCRRLACDGTQWWIT